MRPLSIITVAFLALAFRARAEPLKPVTLSVSAIPLAQMLGTAEVIGEWKLLNGNGDLRLIRVLSRAGSECGASGDDDANTCPRYTLFVVLNGELADPVQFTAYQLPEALGWSLPKSFNPDESAETTTVPLRVCEMIQTPKGFGWRGVSYKLVVSEKMTSGDPIFAFSASLTKNAGQRADCVDSQ